MRKFIPPLSDVERCLMEEADKLLRQAGFSADGLPLDRQRAADQRLARRIEILTPTGGQGRRR